MYLTKNVITFLTLFSIGYRPNDTVSRLVRMVIWQRSTSLSTRFYPVSFIFVIMFLILYSLWKSYDNRTMDVWIGGNKMKDCRTNTWKWSDGSQWSYTQWAPGEWLWIQIFIYNCNFDFPSSQPLSHCASMNIGNASKSLWTNSQCSTLKSFICQSELIESLSNVSHHHSPSSPCPPLWIYNPQLNNCYRVDNNHFWLLLNCSKISKWYINRNSWF